MAVVAGVAVAGVADGAVAHVVAVLVAAPVSTLAAEAVVAAATAAVADVTDSCSFIFSFSGCCTSCTLSHRARRLPPLFTSSSSISAERKSERERESESEKAREEQDGREAAIKKEGGRENTPCECRSQSAANTQRQSC